jgi:hypothetical protein
MSQVDDDGAVTERPRWAARELISWLAAGLLLVGLVTLVGSAFRCVDLIRGPDVQVAVGDVFTVRR